MPSRSRRTLALVELLVAVVIIVLLLAILVPALHAAHERAVQQVCRGRLHQLSLAVSMYRNENRDQYPVASYMPSVGPEPLETDRPIFIADVMLPYLSGQTRVFQCPNDVANLSEREPPNTGKSFFETERSSYYWDLCFWVQYEAFHGHTWSPETWPPPP